jgi:hypothetical protein
MVAFALVCAGFKRKGVRFRNLIFLLCASCLMALNSCGGGSGSGSGGQSTPPPNTSATITITGTSGSLSHSAQLVVTVN